MGIAPPHIHMQVLLMCGLNAIMLYIPHVVTTLRINYIAMTVQQSSVGDTTASPAAGCGASSSAGVIGEKGGPS